MNIVADRTSQDDEDIYLVNYQVISKKYKELEYYSSSNLFYFFKITNNLIKYFCLVLRLMLHKNHFSVPVHAPAHNKERQSAYTTNIVEDVYSFESFNPKSSATKNKPNAEDIAQLPLSPKKRLYNMQLIYEKEEADRIAQGKNRSGLSVIA